MKPETNPIRQFIPIIVKNIKKQKKVCTSGEWFDNFTDDTSYVAVAKISVGYE